MLPLVALTLPLTSCLPHVEVAFRPINTVGLPATVLEIGSGVMVVGKVMGKAFDVGTTLYSLPCTPRRSLRVHLPPLVLFLHRG